MAYRYNPEKGRPYRKGTYTDFTPEKKEKSKAQKDQEIETKYKIMIATTIANKISEDGSNIDIIVNEIAKNPIIRDHYKRLIEKEIDLPDLFKKWYEGYKPFINKDNKGTEK